MLRFHDPKEEIFDAKELQITKNDYVTFSRKLDAFQKKKFQNWNEKIIDEAMKFLKNLILTMKSDCHYEVIN